MLGRSARLRSDSAAERAPWARAARRPRLGRLLLPYLFVAPVMVTLLALVGYPIMRVVQVSLYTDYIVTDQPRFVGFDNYAVMASEPAFWKAGLNSLLFTAGSVLLHVSLGLGIALFLNRRFNPTVRAAFRSVFILPWLFVPVIVTLIWKLILHPAGAVNSTLTSLGLLTGPPIDWFADFSLAMPALIVANVWAGYAFSMLMLLAGLQSIPAVLYEAAAVDGADSWQRFRHVTLPGLGPMLATVALLDSIWTFRLFDLPYLLTGGGPADTTLVLPLLTYREAFEGFRFGQSSAVAVVILVVTLVVSFFYLRYRARLLEQS
jgi:multiple sugar transport system permease protein